MSPTTPANPMDDLRQASADVSGVKILSPAAQAVLDAADSVYWDWGTMYAASPSTIAAAALLAAAGQASPEKLVEDIDYVHQSYIDGMRDVLAVITEIADELDGTNNTRRSN